MSSKEWNTFSLGELTEKITKGTTPTTMGYPFVESGINFIKAESILADGSIDSSKFVFIDAATHRKLKRSQIEENDILFSMAGMVLGKSAVVRKELLPANTNQALAIIRLRKDLAIPQFVSYFMRQRHFFNYVNQSTGQSAQPNINLEEIGNLEITLPPIPIQKRITAILSVLDEKIELNRQTNATLETIAQAIFKEWFVDFNFPDATGEMVESELGMIPRGWLVGSIGEFFDFVIGGDWGKEEQDEEYSELCAVIRGTDINDIWFGQSTNVPRRFIKASSLKKRTLKEGDIVFEISGGSKEQATGRNLLIVDDVLQLFDEKVIPASFCRLIRAKDLATAVFLGTYLRVLYANGGTWDYQLQSTGISNFQFADFESREKLAIPASSILSRFTALVLPMYQTIGHTNKQSATLATIRDAFLPKLMSGEIEV